ncbi:MAG: 5-oxoprolinase/urea amidolyase family protein [Solirubrobacteraceae bacterium]
MATRLTELPTVAGGSMLIQRPGPQTSVQELPGRLGYWGVGVPPSGPMDERAFRAANALVGNAAGAAGLEFMLAGPVLTFECDATVAVTGAPARVEIAGEQQEMWQPLAVPAGAELAIGRLRGPGMRGYLAVRGALAAEQYLGSGATFMLGGFGGHAGRALRAADRLVIGDQPARLAPAQVGGQRVYYSERWTLRVTRGPQGAPEHFSAEDLDRLLKAEWTVHHHSDRTGIRLNGPAPAWPRADGGDAGLHPSNVHDNAYAVGAVTFAGDQPLIIGVDGPSLGGFVSPACVVRADRWKLGQLRPGDRVRFATVRDRPARLGSEEVACDGTPAAIRAAGDERVLVELGNGAFELGHRVHVHSLAKQLAELRLDGIVDVTEGVRSLQVHHRPGWLAASELVGTLRELCAALPAPVDVEIPARTIHLPLSWDDPAAQLAVDRYASMVRADAPWCPSNLEFIRRINGLEDIEAVRRIVFDAAYLVLGLGDVYLGAPVALPLDPRHRLMTTKYTPPRTWTPQNAVGLGGTYMCIYGMEGPGGYQLVGRTVPVWGTRQAGPPWLLRCFDHIRFEPVEHDELAEISADLRDGRRSLRVSEGTFSLGEHERFLERSRGSIDAVLRARRAAFDAERARWGMAVGT